MGITTREPVPAREYYYGMWDEEGPIGARRAIIVAIVALLAGLAIAFGFVFFILPRMGTLPAQQNTAPVVQTPQTPLEKAQSTLQQNARLSGTSTESVNNLQAAQDSLKQNSASNNQNTTPQSLIEAQAILLQNEKNAAH